MVRVFVQKFGIFIKKTFSKKTSKHEKVLFDLIYFKNPTFYLIETMVKPNETSKKFKFFEKKLQKFQVFGKNCKNFKYLEKIEKNFKYLEKIAEIS